MLFASLFISICTLFPFCPYFGAVTGSGLLPVTDNGCFHEAGIIKDLVFFGPLIIHIFHQGDLRVLAVPVNEIIDTAHSPENAVKFLSGHAKANQVNGLVFDPALLKPALSFFGIKAFVFTKYLDVQ